MSTLIKSDVIKANTLPSSENIIDGMYVSATRQPYVSPTPGELPLVAIGGVRIGTGNILPSGEEQKYNTINLPYLELIKECGFNSALLEFGEKDYATQSLECGHQAGIRTFVRMAKWNGVELPCSESLDPIQEAKEHLFNTGNSGEEREPAGKEAGNWTSRAQRVINAWDAVVGIGDDSYQCWKDEACAGYELTDEPNLRAYPWLAKLKDRITANDPWKSMPFVNLNPIYAESNRGGLGVGTMIGCSQRKYIGVNGGTFDLMQAGAYNPQSPGSAYRIYLDEFEKVFRPAVWCYDFYLLGDQPNVKEPNYHLQYFENLELMRKKALQSNRPFWGNVRGSSRPGVGSPASSGGNQVSKYAISADYINLLVAAMKIEARTLLAYGAKGLMFCTVMTEPLFSWAPLNLGEKDKYEESTGIYTSPLYEPLKALLAELKSVGGLFLSSKVLATDHIHHQKFGKSGDAVKFGFIKDIDATDGGSYSLAHHETATMEFIVMVNTDVKPRIKDGEEVPYEVTFKGDGSSQFHNMLNADTFNPLTGEKKKLPADWTGGGSPYPGGSEGQFEPMPDPFDPYPSEPFKSDDTIGVRFNPGDWAIFYRYKNS